MEKSSLAKSLAELEQDLANLLKRVEALEKWVEQSVKDNTFSEEGIKAMRC